MFLDNNSLSKILIAFFFSIGLVSIKFIGFISILLLSVSYFITINYASTYGEASFGSIASIFETNFIEATEFFSSLELIPIVFYLLITLGLSYSLFLIKVDRINKTIPIYFTFFYSTLSLFSFFYIVGSKEVSSSTPMRVLRYNLVTNYSAHLSEYYRFLRIEKNSQINSEWQGVSESSSDSDIFIVVVGESVMSSHINLYGYDKRTTENIEKYAGVKIISNAISPSTQTMTSLPRVLTLNEGLNANYNLNIIDLVNLSGLESVWLSNQGRFGKYDSATSVIANRANEVIYLNNNFHDASSDFLMLNYFDKKLKTYNPVTQKSVVFMHTIGSHYDFCKRSSDGLYEMLSFQNTVIDCYDNSIFNTFKLIEDLQSLLVDSQLKYKIIFFSDHGMVETEEFPYIVHGVGKKFSEKAVDVPLIFWDSSQTGLNVLKKRYMMKDFIHTFSDWLGVKSNMYNKDLSVFSDAYYVNDNFVLKDDLSKFYLD